MNARTPDDLEATLAGLDAPVRLVFFTQTFGCDSCLSARQVVDRVASVSDQITVEEFNLVLDTDQVEAYGIQRVPAIAVVGESDVGIRFYGVPEGHELVSLVEAIALVASGDSGLSDASRALVATVDQPIHIQVFATPT
jgi:alkyl hydroperoxide reductase subunit AhpF